MKLSILMQAYGALQAAKASEKLELHIWMQVVHAAGALEAEMIKQGVLVEVTDDAKAEAAEVPR